MSEQPNWEPKGPMKVLGTVLYNASPTIGEETTVTIMDADGNVESHTFIAEEPDDCDDDIPSMKPLFTEEQRAQFLKDGTTFRVALRTDE